MNAIGVVGIISTGVANTASVIAALQRLGLRAEPVNDWRSVDSHRWLILPGVGAFGPAMDRLHSMKMVEPLRERISADRPTLAICLGLHLFCELSDESPDTSGLAIVPATASRFDSSNGHRLRIPHLGWNQVSANGCRSLVDGEAYFAHSYRVEQVPDGWCVATANYGGSFVAAIEKGNVLACQFHPELSGAWGRRVLSNWINQPQVPTC